MADYLPDDRKSDKLTPPGSGPKDIDPNWGQFAGIGLQMAVGVGLGLVVGHWLDKRYGWGSRGEIIGALLGMASGMYLLIRDAIRMNK